MTAAQTELPPAARPAPRVTAVVVTEGLTDYLPRTVAALAAQTVPPDEVVVVDVGADPDPDPQVGDLVARHWPDGSARIVTAAGARTLGHGVRAALAADNAVAAPWLWLLHDDSAPEPGALAALLRAVEIAPSVAVAGCKQHTWSEPSRVIEVGVWTSRFGRRTTGIDGPEVDQGQHDAREDVLAVGTAGALVRRDVWDRLGGTDPALGPYGDGLDLCRRARLAGHRVIVVPAAVVRHARASVPRSGALGRQRWDARRSAQARRSAFVHAQLVGAPAPLVPLIVLLALLSGPVRAVGRLVVKEPHLVTAELVAPWAALARPGRLLEARRRARATRVLPRRALRPLEATWSDVLRQVRDRRMATAERRRVRTAPSELEIAELIALRRRRRGVLAVVVTLALAVSVVTLGPLVGGRLVGGSLALGDAGVGELWSAVSSWWLPAGFGTPAPPDPLWWVLLPLVAVTGSTGAAAGLAFLAGLVVSALGAWFAAGAVTRSVGLRAWATLVWVGAPALLISVESGRFGAVLAHAALPWFALGLARGVGLARTDAVRSGLDDARRPGADQESEPRRHRSGALSRAAEPSLAAAAGAALVLVVLTAAAPVLLPAVLVVLVGVVVVVPRRHRVLWIAVPALVVHGPLLAEALGGMADGRWRVLLADPGVPVAGPVAEPWEHLLGWPVPVAEVAAGWAVDVPAIALLVVTGVLALLAVPALLVPGAAVRAGRIGWWTVAVGIAAAAVVVRVPVAVAGAGGPTTTTASVAPAVSLVVCGLLLAALVAATRVRAVLADRPFGWVQVVAAVVAFAAVIGPAGTLGVWTWQHRGAGELEVQRVTEPVVPAVGRQMQTAPENARVLSLVSDGDVVRARLLRADGAQLLEESRSASVDAVLGGADEAQTVFADVVARLAVGSAGDLATDLAPLGVGAVLVPPQATPERTALVGRLDATEGLERVTETDAGVIWRVTAATAGTTSAWARLRPDGGDGPAVVVPSSGTRVQTRIEPGDGPRLLILAERADPGWQATLDGRPLRAVPAQWRQVFQVGADGGLLVVEHTSAAQTVWLVGQLVVLTVTALLALPVRRRRGVDR